MKGLNPTTDERRLRECIKSFQNIQNPFEIEIVIKRNIKPTENPTEKRKQQLTNIINKVMSYAFQEIIVLKENPTNIAIRHAYVIFDSF
jgi:hypothetical protein